MVPNIQLQITWKINWEMFQPKLEKKMDSPKRFIQWSAYIFNNNCLEWLVIPKWENMKKFQLNTCTEQKKWEIISLENIQRPIREFNSFRANKENDKSEWRKKMFVVGCKFRESGHNCIQNITSMTSWMACKKSQFIERCSLFHRYNNTHARTQDNDLNHWEPYSRSNRA